MFVPGADEDMVRLSKLIRAQAHRIDHIVVTLDTHPVIDISHPVFWHERLVISAAVYAHFHG